MTVQHPPDYLEPVWPPLTAQRPAFFEGLDIYHFLVQVDRWVHRRVEQVDFLDDRSVRRRVSVDFELPANMPDREIAGTPIDLVPLALLRKRPLVGFDLRDESGSTVPLLTREQNAFVAWSLLAAVGEAAARNAGFSLPLPLDVLSDLRLLASEQPEKARSAFKTFIKPRKRESRFLRRALMKDEVFRSLAEALTENFMLLVLLEHESSRRRVLKYSYQEPLPFPAFRLFRRQSARRFFWFLRVRLGLTAVPLDFEVPAMNEANTFHFEVESPRGLVVQSAEIVDDTTDEILVEVAEPEGSRVHLYASSQVETTGATAWVWLQPAVSGLVRISAIFSVAVGYFLAAIALRAEYVNPGPAMSLLLAIPGFLAIFIIRPGEHLLASRILLGFRSVVLLAGLLPLVAAVALLVGLPANAKQWMWWGLATTAAGLAWLTARVHSSAKAVSLRED